MRYIRLMLLGLLFSVVAWAEENDGFRTLTDKEGRTVKVRLVDYNPSDGKLGVRVVDGKQIWVSPDIFCDEDRQYIRKWVAYFERISSRSLEVSIKQEKKGESAYYAVTLHNTSEKTIQGITINYCCFCRTVGYKGRKDHDWRKPGSLEVPRLPPGEKITLKTGLIELKIYTEAAQSSSWKVSVDGSARMVPEVYSIKIAEDRLLGIWLKLVAEREEGSDCTRDICDPKHLSENVVWNGSVIPLESETDLPALPTPIWEPPEIPPPTL